MFLEQHFICNWVVSVGIQTTVSQVKSFKPIWLLTPHYINVNVIRSSKWVNPNLGFEELQSLS